jgi:hypothetical protein
LLPLPERRSFFERLFEPQDDDSAFATTPSLHAWLGKLESMANYSEWTILPGVPQVQ